MKRPLLAILILLVFACSFTRIHARELTANLSYAAFSTPDNKTYVETYLSLIGSSVYYVKNEKGNYQAAVDILMTVTSNDSIKDFRRYVLHSPETSDTNNCPNFLDLQRFTLPIGLYDLQITMFDVNRKPQRVITNKRSLIADIDPDSIGLSHIEMLESYEKATKQSTITKSGYDLIPYVASFYPGNMANSHFLC
jgi:hypothetical protein